VAVLVDRPRIDSARAVHLSVTIRVVVPAFTEVPAVVGAGLCVICLLPALPTDVVDAKARVRGVGAECHPEGVPEAPGEGLLAVVPASCASGLVAPVAVRSRVRVGRRDSAIPPYAQDLAEQDFPISGGVVLVLALRPLRVITSAVADAYVEEFVLAELQVTAVVPSLDREDIMEDTILTTYYLLEEFLLEEFLKATGHRDDPQVVLSTAEVMTTAVAAAAFFGGNIEASRSFLDEYGYIEKAISKSRFNRRLHAIDPCLWRTLFDVLADSGFQ
jgi:hypothetical protein